MGFITLAWWWIFGLHLDELETNVPSGWMLSQNDFASFSVLIGNSMGVGLVTRKILCYTYLLMLDIQDLRGC